MKLTLSENNLVIPFYENQVLVIVLEKPSTFTGFLQCLCNQCNGGDGMLVLSEKESILPIESNINVIWNPLAIDFSDRKILNKLYQEMRSVSEEHCFFDMEKVRREIATYLNKASAMLPYPIAYEERLDDVTLYKMCNVKLDMDICDMQQRLVEYIKILSMLCGIQIVVFVNLKDYLDEEQLLELYKTAFYYKIHILLVEATQRNILQNEKYYIFDQDDCLIEI